jgi:hypothetical protein
MKTLRTVDQIAKEKHRDVVYVAFASHTVDWHHPEPYWTSNTHPRHKITEWLKANNIQWEDCYEFKHPTLHEIYPGHFYIDIAYDLNNPKFQALVSFIEDEHGNVKPEFGENTKFCLLPLTVVLPHGKYDELGY